MVQSVGAKAIKDLLPDARPDQEGNTKGSRPLTGSWVNNQIIKGSIMLRPSADKMRFQLLSRWIKRSHRNPSIIGVATGSGRSRDRPLTIAKWITDNTSRGLLELQPGRELAQ